MTFCRLCGTEIKEGVRFCPKCGTMVKPGKDDSHSDVPDPEPVVVMPGVGPGQIESDFDGVDSDSFIIRPEPEPVQEEPVMTPSHVASSSPSPKRKGHVKVIAALAVVAIIVVAAIVLMTPDKCDLNLSTNGSGSVTGSGTYEFGDYVTIEAKGYNGMEFYKWSDGNTSATRTISMTDDVDLVAYFDYFYDITLKANNPDYGDVTGGGHIKKGESVTITATPNTGYRFVNWTQNGIVVSTNPNYTISVYSDAKYTAVFEPMTFTIKTTSNNPYRGQYSAGGTYTYLTSITLSASTYSGYEFLGWYDGSKLCSSSYKYSFQVTEDKTYTAKFGIIHDATFYGSQTSAMAPATFSFTSKYNVEIVSSQWTLTNFYGGSLVGSDSSPTEYGYTSTGPSYITVKRTVTYSDGQTATYSMNCLADYIYQKTVDFRYSNGDWWSTLWGGYSNVSTSITYSIKWSDYMYYAHKDLDSRRGNIDQGFMQKFIIPSDDVIQQIAKNVRNNTSGLTQLQRAQYALNMVQMMVSYEYDQNRKGQTEYFGYAVETLYEGKGDCDDSAIIYANVMKALGYQTALCVLYYSNSAHLCAMIACPGADGYGLTINGTNYYFAEATDDAGNNLFFRRDIGCKPNGFKDWSSTEYKVFVV